MKKHFNSGLISIIALSGLALTLFACKKDKAGEPSAATAVTSAAAWVGQTWATLNGVVTANNITTIVSFEYGTSTDYGMRIDAFPDTLTGNYSTLVHANLTRLQPKTTYHYRTSAANTDGPVYGTDMTFTTTDIKPVDIVFNPDLTYGSVSDNDGNVYKTIQIGAQTWMAENLRTTTLNDNTSIPLRTIYSTWTVLSTPAYCWYNNDSVAYGIMYNWYAVKTGKLCPAGWHVPADSEWTTLATTLGGDSVAGKKMKETGSIHWLTPNSGATNESGFTALPGGYRNAGTGVFSDLKKLGYFWSATEYNAIDAIYLLLSYNSGHSESGSSNKNTGLSVRCLKDN
jgi:uncharacterized protein (TIGR02145 family)